MSKILYGDNLIMLDKVPDNSVNLIYMDPPFFTQSIRKCKDNSYSDKFKSKEEYLEILEKVLRKCKDKLKDTGSIYVHLDYHSVYEVKPLLDTIFGEDNFRNDIVWYYTGNNMTSAKKIFPRKHDNILFYTKTDNYIFNQQRDKEISKGYMKTWGKFMNEKGEVLFEKIKHQPGNVRKYKPLLEKRLKRPIKDNDVVLIVQPALCKSVWTDINAIKNSLKSNEFYDYPTQKPVELIIRIINASSNEGDTVLDPYAGSGTTGAACQITNRKYILIDNNSQAINIMWDRLK